MAEGQRKREGNRERERGGGMGTLPVLVSLSAFP